MSNNRFSCLKPPNNGDISNNNTSYEPGNKFKRYQQNNRWDRNNSPKKNSRFPSPERNSRFPPPERNSRFPPPERNSRFPSPEGNSRFPSPERNSRFSGEKNNSFTKSKDDKPRYSRGGFGKFTYNHGRRSKGPSVFDNVKKDSQGRPMLSNATTSAFDIDSVLKKADKSKKNDKPKKKRKKKNNQTTSFFEEEKKTEEERKAEKEWNKQMILNMQYATDSEDELFEDENQEEL